jgi:hypothetical protein
VLLFTAVVVPVIGDAVPEGKGETQTWGGEENGEAWALAADMTCRYSLSHWQCATKCPRRRHSKRSRTVHGFSMLWREPELVATFSLMEDGWVERRPAVGPGRGCPRRLVANCGAKAGSDYVSYSHIPSL